METEEETGRLHQQVPVATPHHTVRLLATHTRNHARHLRTQRLPLLLRRKEQSAHHNTQEQSGLYHGRRHGLSRPRHDSQSPEERISQKVRRRESRTVGG
uniref:Uncharacterized protein n=1 Tax=Cacopsylla melanoneura TaxID=428564 RepID=A0A8D8Q4R0_9HEMI